MNLQAILVTAIAIARQAGALLRDGYGQKKEVARKSTAIDWVTQFDETAESLIVERLRDAFPRHGIVAEEGSRADGHGLTWYVDPLDGTTNFAHGLPHFSVSLALYEGNAPLVGVVYDPLRDECFSSARGHGAFLDSPRGRDPLHVSDTAELVSSVIGTGFPYDRHTSDHDNVAQLHTVLKRVQGVRRGGSAALDVAYVAAGRLDGYWEFKLNPWDVGAGVALVQEAGGTVTLIDGAPFAVAPPVSLLASNGRIHDPMLGLLTQH